MPSRSANGPVSHRATSPKLRAPGPRTARWRRRRAGPCRRVHRRAERVVEVAAPGCDHGHLDTRTLAARPAPLRGLGSSVIPIACDDAFGDAGGGSGSGEAPRRQRRGARRVRHRVVRSESTVSMPSAMSSTRHRICLATLLWGRSRRRSGPVLAPGHVPTRCTVVSGLNRFARLSSSAFLSPGHRDGVDRVARRVIVHRRAALLFASRSLSGPEPGVRRRAPDLVLEPRIQIGSAIEHPTPHPEVGGSVADHPISFECAGAHVPHTPPLRSSSANRLVSSRDVPHWLALPVRPAGA